MLKTKISSFLLAVILGSSCLSEPAAAFLGFAKVCSESSSFFSFNLINAALGIYTSPLTSKRFLSLILRGMLFMVLMLFVTSSPILPSPLVAPLISSPFSYKSDTESPSIFSSTTNSASL